MSQVAIADPDSSTTKLLSTPDFDVSATALIFSIAHPASLIALSYTFQPIS